MQNPGKFWSSHPLIEKTFVKRPLEFRYSTIQCATTVCSIPLLRRSTEICLQKIQKCSMNDLNTLLLCEIICMHWLKGKKQFPEMGTHWNLWEFAQRGTCWNTRHGGVGGSRWGTFLVPYPILMGRDSRNTSDFWLHSPS